MKNIFSSRRNKSPHNNEEAEKTEASFFSKESKTPFFNGSSGLGVQTKLTVGQPGDKYEKEADSMADAVVNNSSKPDIQNKEISSIQRESLATPQEDEKLGTAEQRMEEDKLVQEKPEVQKMEEPEEEMVNKMEGEEEEGMVNKMDEEQEEEGAVQTKSNTANQTASNGLSQQIKSKSGKGKSLSKSTKAEMESSFGTDFSDVNIHTDNDAVKMNKELGAQAFTHGKDVYFNSGKYNPDSTTGKHLLAHELTHVVQQSQNTIRKTPKRVGTRFTHPRRARSRFRVIRGLFDGRNFKLYGDGRLLMTVSAQSGRPYNVNSADARRCGGSTSDSYMNNPKYVGVRDNGPIPEGVYRFRATSIATFNEQERLDIISGDRFTDPFGRRMHGGDWGAGRVALSPQRIVRGPRGCGNTRARSGFYLHGGIMPGSSGCIDVGNSGFESILTHLRGYTRQISIRVQYLHSAPTVGAFDRALGRFTYPGGANPDLLDRVRSFFD